MSKQSMQWQPGKLFAAAVLALAGSGLAACSSSSGGSSDDDSGGGSTPSTTIGEAIANSAPLSGDAECGGTIGTFTGFTFDHDGDAGTDELNICNITGRITEDVTLTSDIVWQLTGLVAVGFGNLEVEDASDVELLKTEGVELTIEAGTLFRNANQSALVVTRGSSINAAGTAADPIILGSGNDTDFDDRGQWGGLVIQGFGLHNECNDTDSSNDDSLPTDPVCNISGEGNSGNFGGNDNTDSSGTLRYVVVAEAGFEVTPNDELNGISFQGVGNGTTVEFIQVHNNQDDGVEFFGGAVNAKWLVLTSNRDDDVDWDEGYLGNLQYVIVKKATSADVTSDPRGIEADSAGGSNVAQPIAMPSLANMIFIGDPIYSDQAVVLRRGTGALIYNSIFKDFPECLDVDDSESNDLILSGGLQFINAFTDCAAQFDDNDELGAGIDYATNLTGANGNVITNGALTIDAAVAGQTGVVDGLTAIAPPEAGGTTGFFDATTYAGAVAPGTAEESAWWADWTVAGSLD